MPADESEMETLITNLCSEKRRTFITIIVIFTITIVLSRNFECNCNSKEPDCWIHMALPWAMIFVLMLWTNSSFQRICRYTCDGTCVCKRHRFCASFFCHILKSFLVSLLWAVYLFFSGSWYICCQSHLSNRTEQAQLPCKDKWKLTSKEQELITELNNEAKRYGYFLLLFVIGAAALISLPNWRKCCKTILCHFDGKNTYYKLILEEEAMVREEVLRKKVKEKLSDRLKKVIDNKEWEKCLNVAEELIETENNSSSSFELEEASAPLLQHPRSSVSEESLQEILQT